MKLNFTPTLQTNNLVSSYQINRSAANKSGVGSAKEETERRDSFVRSSMGNTRSFIQDLMKQKVDITDRRNALIASAKKEGASMESIKTQLEAYDEQLANIDAQISQAMTNEMEKEREKNTGKDDEPKTKEELQYKKMTDVVTLSNDAGHIELLDSVKNKVDGRIKVLESEIALDNGREGTSSYKLEQLSQLKQRSAKLETDLGFRIADLVNESNESSDETPEEDSSEEYLSKDGSGNDTEL